MGTWSTCLEEIVKEAALLRSKVIQRGQDCSFRVESCVRFILNHFFKVMADPLTSVVSCITNQAPLI